MIRACFGTPRSSHDRVTNLRRMAPKLLIGLGVLLLGIGLVWQFAPGLLSWFGRLPGDITIERGNTRVFVPITSMIIVSVVLSLILSFFFRR